MFRKPSIRSIGLALIAATMLAASSSPALAAPAADMADFKLSVKGLEDLGKGWVYEGWLIVGGKPVSTGVFTIDDKGSQSQTSFPVEADALGKATTFVLTIEPSPDNDPAPSDVHVLGGNFRGKTAQLTLAHSAALGNAFRAARGSYVLAVPSDAATSYTNGIWFENPKTARASFILPKLPKGWVYEGWVVGPDGPISTGRFADPSKADSDGAGPTAGKSGAPALPGQDFVDPPVSLIGYAAVISIEPEPDNSPAPFAFKPLLDQSIDDTGPGLAPQAMRNNARAFPTGVAMR
jgi:hypothetical protein